VVVYSRPAYLVAAFGASYRRAENGRLHVIGG